MTPAKVRLSLSDEQRKKPKAWHQTYFFNEGFKAAETQYVRPIERKMYELKQELSEQRQEFAQIEMLKKENEALKKLLDDVRKLLMIKI